MVVIHTREGHEPDLHDCPPTKLDRWPEGTRIGDVGPMGRILVRGEEGHDIIDEVYPLPQEYLLDKPGKNAFYGTELERILQAHDIRHLLITGVTTDVCCFATTIAANDRGYHALVLSDCVASYSPERHAAASGHHPGARGHLWLCNRISRGACRAGECANIAAPRSPCPHP